MGKIDDKSISVLLERIDGIRKELAALEEEVKALVVVEEETSPIDITISDIEMPVPPVIEPVEPVQPVNAVEEEAVPEEAMEEVPEEVAEEPVETPVEVVVEEETPVEDIIDDIPEVVPVTEPVEVPELRKSILDSAKADTAVMDVMADKQAWRTDRPGMPVKNIISAISLNDRVLLINVLFREDPMLFQETIAKFNAMGSLSEALGYISENFPDWDMNSEPVYRLMMAVRRKLS